MALDPERVGQLSRSVVPVICATTNNDYNSRTARTSPVCMSIARFSKRSSVYVRGLAVPALSMAIAWEIVARHFGPRDTVEVRVYYPKICAVCTMYGTQPDGRAYFLTFRRLQNSVVCCSRPTTPGPHT